MTTFSAKGLDHRRLNELIRAADHEVTVGDCLGQRFIAAGMDDKKITLLGTPGNALGAYLNGAEITVRGNAQDAVGDTMNSGSIVVCGDIGDAAGYAMRGGKLFVKGNAGYRAGIHMKEYGDKRPVMVIGGRCGSFLSEYQAGGVVIVLGLGGGAIVRDFPFAGMHGGRVYLRSDCRGVLFPKNVHASAATADDLRDIGGEIDEFCALFDCDKADIMSAPFTKVEPNGGNPYKRMYAVW